jgi:tRNA threonylcarbamoyl adenosine modification protein YeaZ
MTYGLALHTSSPALGLAIGNGDRPRIQTWDLGRGVSDLLHPYLADFLKPQTWADLSWIAVAGGPGGFTGTRLSVVTARTLGQQLEIPVFTISGLAAISWQLGDNGTIAVSMPAGREEIFGAVYSVDRQRQLEPIVADATWTIADWQRTLARFDLDRQYEVAAAANLADTVAGVFELARMAYARGDRPHWGMAVPFYGQHPIVNNTTKK